MAGTSDDEKYYHLNVSVSNGELALAPTAGRCATNPPIATRGNAKMLSNLATGGRSARLDL
jgi:hypothetical protein